MFPEQRIAAARLAPTDYFCNRGRFVMLPGERNHIFAGAHRIRGIRFDALPGGWELYKQCHLIENDFAGIKEFRGIATRYDKADTSHAVTLKIVAAISGAG